MGNECKMTVVTLRYVVTMFVDWLIEDFDGVNNDNLFLVQGGQVQASEGLARH